MNKDDAVYFNHTEYFINATESRRDAGGFFAAVSAAVNNNSTRDNNATAPNNGGVRRHLSNVLQLSGHERHLNHMRRLESVPPPSDQPDALNKTLVDDMMVDPKPMGAQFYEYSDENWYYMNSWGGFLDYSVMTESSNPDEPSMTFYGQEFYASYGVDWNNYDLMTLRVEGFGGCIKGVVCIDGATEFTHPKHLSFRADDFSEPFAVQEIKVPENFTDIVMEAFGNNATKLEEMVSPRPSTDPSPPQPTTVPPPPKGNRVRRNLAERQERRLHSHEPLLEKIPDCRSDLDCGSANATCMIDPSTNSTAGKCLFFCRDNRDCDAYPPFDPNVVSGIECNYNAFEGGICLPHGLVEAMQAAQSGYVNTTVETMYDYPPLKEKPQDLGIKIDFKNLFTAIKLDEPLPESIMREINEVLKDAQDEIGRIPVQFAPYQDPIGNKLIFSADDAMQLQKPLYKNVLQVKGDFPIDFPGATADYLRGSFWVDISLRLEGFLDEQFNPISSEKNIYVKMGFNIEFLDVAKMGWMHGAPGWQRIYQTDLVDGQWQISRF